MKMKWTKEENEICCRSYIQIYVQGKRSVSATAVAKDLQRLLPGRSLGTIRMKLQNCKAISDEMNLNDSAPFKPLVNPSADNREAFHRIVKQLGY